MARRGHRVHVVSSELPQRLDHGLNNVTFHAVEARPDASQQGQYALALAAKLVEVAGWHGLDVVHAHYAIPHAISAVLARQLLADRAFKVVTTLHGTDITSVEADAPFGPMTRYAIVQSDAVTVPSRFLRDETARKFGVEGGGIEVILNFVDSEHFAPQPDTEGRTAVGRLFAEGTAKRPLSDDSLVCVHVSNHRPVKRVHDAVTAFAKAAEHVDARLVMIGDGPDRSSARALAQKLGVCDRVAFVGKRRSFVSLLAAADLFLLPSESESFGLAALEAQSCGIPVIASDVGGVPEVVAHAETGLLCPMGDTDAFAEAIVTLARDPGRRREIGNAARSRAASLFAAGPSADRYEAVYRRVLSGA